MREEWEELALSGLKPLADTSHLRKALWYWASMDGRLAGRLDSSGVWKIGQCSANMLAVLARGDAEADGGGRCHSVHCLLGKASGSLGFLAQCSGTWEGVIPGWQQICDNKVWLGGQGLLHQCRVIVSLKSHSYAVLYRLKTAPHKDVAGPFPMELERSSFHLQKQEAIAFPLTGKMSSEVLLAGAGFLPLLEMMYTSYLCAWEPNFKGNLLELELVGVSVGPLPWCCRETASSSSCAVGELTSIVLVCCC